MRAAFTCVLPIALASAAFGQTTFQPLGFAPNTGLSRAFGISRDGTRIVGANVSHAVLWTAATGMRDIGVVPGTSFSAAFGASDNGVVVGYSGNPAMKWTQQDGMVSLAMLSGDSGAQALAVSSDGSVIVGKSYRFANGKTVSTPVMWTSSGITALAAGDTQGAQANAVSSDGTVVVGVSQGKAFRWTLGTGLQFLVEPLPDSGSAAFAISSDGTFTVGQSKNYGAIRWSNGSATSFFTSNRSFQQGLGVSSDGSVALLDDGLWMEPNGPIDLLSFLHSKGITSADKWPSLGCTAMSDAGDRICGTGTTPAGRTEAFMITLSPQTSPSPELSSISADPSTRVFGNDFNLVAMLHQPADQALYMDTLVSNSGRSSVFQPRVSSSFPGFFGVYIRKGATQGLEPIHLLNQVSLSTYPVWMTYKGLQYPAALTAILPSLYNPALSATTVHGGAIIQCTLKLNGESPDASVATFQIAVTTSNPSVIALPSVLAFPAASTLMTIPIQTYSVTQPTQVQLTFRYSGMQTPKSVTITVNP